MKTSIKSLIAIVLFLLTMSNAYADEIPFELGELVFSPVDFQQVKSNQIVKFNNSGLQSLEIINIPQNIASLEYQEDSIACLGGIKQEIGFQNPTGVTAGQATVNFVLPNINDKNYTGQLVFKALDVDGNDLNMDLKINFIQEELFVCPAIADPVCSQFDINRCNELTDSVSPRVFLVSAPNRCSIFSEGFFVRSGECSLGDVPRAIRKKTKKSSSAAPLFLDGRNIIDLKLNFKGQSKKFRQAFIRSNGLDLTKISINETSPSSIKKRKAKFSLSTGDGPLAELFYLELFNKEDDFLTDEPRDIIPLPIIVSGFSDIACDDDGKAVCAELELNICNSEEPRACPIQFVTVPKVRKTFKSSCEAERFGATVVSKGKCKK